MKKFLIGLLSLSVVLVLAGCNSASTDTATDTPAEDSNTIKIGMVAPLTGDAASLGQDEKNLIDLWLEENPTIGDKEIEIIFEDGQCNGQLASRAAQKLINIDKVQFILGGLCSDESLALVPLAENNDVLVFSTTSTSPELSGISKNFLRNAPSDEKNTEVLADYIAENHTKVAIFAQNTDFAQGFYQAISPKLEERNVEVVVDESYNTGTTDFKTIIQKVADSEAEALINISGEPTAAGFISKQSQELGLDVQMYGTDHFLGAEFIDIAKDSANGSIFVNLVANDSNPDVAEFFAKYEEKYGAQPTLRGYAPLEIDRFNILKMAIEAVGENPLEVRDYIVNMDPYQGLGGETDFSEDGNVSILPSLLTFKDGEIVALETEETPEAEDQEETTEE